FFERRNEAENWIEHHHRDSLPVTALCVLSRTHEKQGASLVDVRRLCPPASLHALLTHACCFMTDDAGRKRRTMSNYLNLVARVSIFQVSFATGFQHFSEVLDAVEKLLCVKLPQSGMLGVNGGLTVNAAEART